MPGVVEHLRSPSTCSGGIWSQLLSVGLDVESFQIDIENLSTPFLLEARKQL